MMISFARAGPTRRTKRVVDATPRGTPRSVSIASLSELRRAGRFRVTVAIAPSRTSVTFSMRAERTTGEAAEKGPLSRVETDGFGRVSGEDSERRLCRPEAGEDRGGGDAEVARGDLGEESSEVGCHREVAALEELVVSKPGPAAVDTSAAHAAAENEHRRRGREHGAA